METYQEVVIKGQERKSVAQKKGGSGVSELVSSSVTGRVVRII